MSTMFSEARERRMRFGSANMASHKQLRRKIDGRKE